MISTFSVMYYFLLLLLCYFGVQPSCVVISHFKIKMVKYRIPFKVCIHSLCWLHLIAICGDFSLHISYGYN